MHSSNPASGSLSDLPVVLPRRDLASGRAASDEGWLGAGHRIALVWTAGVSYLGLVGLLSWQALRGQPLTSPDALTLVALVALILAAGATASAVVLRARGGKRK